MAGGWEWPMWGTELGSFERAAHLTARASPALSCSSFKRYFRKTFLMQILSTEIEKKALGKKQDTPETGVLGFLLRDELLCGVCCYYDEKAAEEPEGDHRVGPDRITIDKVKA